MRIPSAAMRISVTCFLLICLVSFGLAKPRVKKANQGKRLEIRCILNAKKYCQDKPAGFIFKDGCRRCQCQLDKVRCKTPYCEQIHTMGTNPAEYCKHILEENQNRLSTRFSPADKEEFRNEYMEPDKTIGSDLKQLSPPADVQLMAHALPVGSDEHQPGEKVNIGPMGPQSVVFPDSPPNEPMPLLRPGGPVGLEPVGPVQSGPGPVDFPLGPGPERPPDVMAQPITGPEGPAPLDFQREHPDSPRPLMEEMGPPKEGPMLPPLPPLSLPLGPEPSLVPQQKPQNPPKTGPNTPSSDHSTVRDHLSIGKQRSKQDRTDFESKSGGLFNLFPKSSGSSKPSSRSKQTKQNTGSLMDHILKKFSKNDGTKKSEKVKKSKKLPKKSTTIGDKPYINYDTPFWLKLNWFDFPGFGPQKNGPHDMQVQPAPPSHMLAGHHLEEPHGPFLMMNHFDEAGSPYPADGLFHPVDINERGWIGDRPGERWLPMDREFVPIPRMAGSSEDGPHGMSPEGPEFLGPRGFPEPFSGFQGPGVPAIGPEGLEPVKLTVQANKNETVMHESSAEEGNEAGSDRTSSDPLSESTPLGEKMKGTLGQLVIQKTSAKENRNRNAGSEYRQPSRRSYYSYPTMSNSPEFLDEDLMSQIRLLENQLRYWRKKYKSCENYRYKIRSALNEEMQRAKNAGFSFRQLSVTVFTIIFVTDWLRRWL